MSDVKMMLLLDSTIRLIIDFLFSRKASLLSAIRGRHEISHHREAGDVSRIVIRDASGRRDVLPITLTSPPNVFALEF